MSKNRVRVVTLNIHKGLSQFNRRLVIHELRDGLRALAPDLVFLQEVQGLNQRLPTRFAGCPPDPETATKPAAAHEPPGPGGPWGPPAPAAQPLQAGAAADAIGPVAGDRTTARSSPAPPGCDMRAVPRLFPFLCTVLLRRSACRQGGASHACFLHSIRSPMAVKCA